MTRRLVYLLMGLYLAALVCVVAAHGVIIVQDTGAPPSGPTTAFDDDFSTDPASRWDEIDGTVEDWFTDGGATEIEIETADGVLIYNGTQPTSADQWAAIELAESIGNNNNRFIGPVLRHKGTDMTNSEYFVMAECEDNLACELTLTICDGEDASGIEGGCESGGIFHTVTNDGMSGGIAEGFAAIMVAGSGSAQEFATWTRAVASFPVDMCDPSTWVADIGHADECVGADTTPNSAIADYCDCGGTSNCVVWDTDPTTIGTPAAGQTKVGLFTYLAIRRFDRACAGDL